MDTQVKSIIGHGLDESKSQVKKRKGGSLSNLALHLPDISKTDSSTLYRAIKVELGEDIADEYGKRLFRAFNDDDNRKLDAWANVIPPPLPYVDARNIVATYKAAISAGTAFYNPRRLFFTLLDDFAQVSEVTSRWKLKDVLQVVSIASTTSDEKIRTAGMLRESIRLHMKSKHTVSIVTLELLTDALTPEILSSFRDQVLEKLTSAQRLDILAAEEVSICQIHLLLRSLEGINDFLGCNP